ARRRGAERRSDPARPGSAAGRGRLGGVPGGRRGRLSAASYSWGMQSPPSGGYFGRALVIDLADPSAEVLTLDGDVLRGYIAGAGLGTWLMHRLAPAGADPLGAEAPLAFCFSPLVGTPLTTSAKFAVVAKSPLTGLLNDALASSHFAIAGKLTGH